MDKLMKKREEELKKNPNYRKNEEEYVKARKSKDSMKALKIADFLSAMEQDKLGPLKSEELEKLKKKKAGQVK